jgi:hypothetical protein
VTLGGSAGSGGNAGSATMSANTGSITTGSGNPTLQTSSTYHGYGIFLQSIGGGGGDGGMAIGGGASTSGSTSLTISIGASGGASGNGSGVSVTNSGAVTTGDYNSDAIIAQSIGGGGGGGNGGAAIADGVTSASSKGLTFAMGGSGSSGGAGSTVSVTNNAGGTISTAGDNSVGIFAQSIGAEVDRAASASVATSMAPLPHRARNWPSRSAAPVEPVVPAAPCR